MKKQIIDTVNDIDIYDCGMFYLVKISGYVYTSKNLNYLKKLVRNRTWQIRLLESIRAKATASLKATGID